MKEWHLEKCSHVLTTPLRFSILEHRSFFLESKSQVKDNEDVYSKKRRNRKEMVAD